VGLVLNSPALTALWAHFLLQSVSITSEEKEPMITKNLLKLANAMAEFEGWNYPGLPGPQKENGSPSWRNHNPGNLRSSPFAIGTKDNFAVFINDDVGFQALVWDLWKKCRGETSTGLTPNSTIYDLIKVYAPPKENDVLKYALLIEKRTDLKMTTKLGDLIK
jgi:hypothetical protein